ncbi:MAG: VTT domain-containing protein [Maricaulaceae bacterium]|jgi:membrane protein DedA with SNARE-associated domain
MESELAQNLQEAMTHNMWSVYLALLLAPFVQEDTAVLVAASFSLSGMGDTSFLFVAVTLGLIASDLWKYWAGRAAHTQAWARRIAEKPAVARARELVDRRLGASLMAARFIPGTRIPLYLASGYFKASWPRFAFWISVSALAYVGAAFALFHTVGAVAGEAAKAWLPAIAIAVLATVLIVQWLRTRRAGKTAAEPGAPD